jgi:hypothetical protein
MITYSIRKRKESEEHHIFEGKLLTTDPLQCENQLESICKKVAHKDTDNVNESCRSEEVARATAAKLGRKVCGTCVSHLYATPE